MGNVAREVIWPTSTNVLVRFVFLYVGQGDSTIVLFKDGTGYKTMLVDINRDKEGNGGISIPKLMADLLKDEKGKLGIFVNTHPHNDHLDDLDNLSKDIDIQEIWHSGHVPGPKHQESYKMLEDAIKKVKKNHGDDAVIELSGSRDAKTLGEAEYYILAPAEHVKDDIADEDHDTRYRRIHEQCAVLKIGKNTTWVMLTGDADRDAWEKHITTYHEKRLPTQVLSAPHHGSKTFFRYDDEDEAYLDALKKIDPKYVIISAPKQSESVHGHPHDDAVEFYGDHVGADNVLHSGENRESYICDIFTDGTYLITPDTKLTDEYGGDEEDDSKEESKGNANSRVKITPAIVSGTKIDQRPMGGQAT